MELTIAIMIAFFGWSGAIVFAIISYRLKQQTERLTFSNAEQGRQLLTANSDLQKRPKLRPVTYRIVTIGMPKTGKTALTMKWAHPTFDLGNLQGTEFAKYRRTVSSVPDMARQTVTNYDFELLDWGGERIVKAHDQLVMEEIHGMLFVVDLALPEATAIDDNRIAQQLHEFQPTALKFFFESERVTRHCKTVVLFINKSDIVDMRPSAVEAIAKEKYKKLIEDLQSYSTRIDLQVLVGSATSGHNTHVLFGHFIQKIMEPDAYDANLFVMSEPAKQ